MKKSTMGLFALFGFALNLNAAVLHAMLRSWSALLYLLVAYICCEFVIQNFINVEGVDNE